MDLAKLKAELTQDEGRRLRPYVDTVGKVTIGVGHNLTDRGISDRVCDLLLEEDVAEVERDLDRALPWWRGLDEVRQRALANLCFNMGLPVLLQFKNSLKHLEHGRFTSAAENFQKSKWYRQVGRRGPIVVRMIRTGKDRNEAP